MSLVCWDDSIAGMTPSIWIGMALTVESQTGCRSKAYAVAQERFEKCLEESPHDIKLISNLAAVHIELQTFPQALAYARRGLQLDSSHVKCWYRCGVASSHLGQYTEAIKCLQKALQLVRTVSATLVIHPQPACNICQIPGDWKTSSLYPTTQQTMLFGMANTDTSPQAYLLCLFWGAMLCPPS